MQRRCWWLSAALLLAAGIAAGWSTYLHWLPCRGSMLSGSVLRGYRYGPDFPDACLRAMDGGMPFGFASGRAEPVAGAAEFAVAAMVLAGLAWLVLVLVIDWPVRLKVVLALPALANLLLALLVWFARGGALPDQVGLVVDLTALAAAVVVMAHVDGRDRTLGLRLMVVLWAATAFGMLPGIFSYGVMISFSDANWDVPPGTGYLTAAVLVIAAGLTMVMAAKSRSHHTATPPAHRTAAL